MPESALPPHLKEDSAWKGSDWDNPFQRWMLPLKKYFAYGPRATETWARWREIPKVLWAKKGKGYWRLENDVDDFICGHYEAPGWYLSRVQYFCRWSVQIQWPLFFSFHVYFKEESVPTYINRKNTDGKLFFFYIGAMRDADRVYWFPAVYIGLNFK